MPVNQDVVASGTMASVVQWQTTGSGWYDLSLIDCASSLFCCVVSSVKFVVFDMFLRCHYLAVVCILSCHC